MHSIRFSFSKTSLKLVTSRRYASHWSPAQRRLLQQALTQVPEHGWTQDAVAAAAVTTNQSIATAGLIQAPQDLVTFCLDDWNDRLRTDLAAFDFGEVNDDTDSTGSELDRLQKAFQIRLDYQKSLMQADRWQEAMALGARPDHVATTTHQLEEMVEIVVAHAWNAAEPLSTLEQFGLGAVYVASELHLLASPMEEDWSFLRQQLEQWNQLRSVAGSLPVSPSAAFQVTSAVGSAVASGIASLVLPASMDPVVSKRK